MKIYDFCFVLSGFPVKIPSGGENIIFNLAGMLARDGYKVCIAVHPQADLELYSKTHDKNFFYPLGKISLVKKFSLKSTPSPILINLTYDILIAYYKIVKAINFATNRDYDYSVLKGVDIIFTKSLDKLDSKIKNIVATSWQAVYLIKSAKREYDRGYYLVQIDEDNPKFSGPLSKYAKQMVADKSLKKIVISKSLLKKFVGEHPKIMNIGISPKFTLPKDEKDQNTVLVPLRNAGGKGASYALEALKIVKEEYPDVKIFAFGNYSRKLPNYINFSRMPNAKEHVKLYQKCAIFILPSLIEGFAAPPLEAMACGCAVVVTKTWGTEEIRNNVNGLVVPIRNSKAIANAVLHLLKDQKLRRKLAREGIKTSREYTYRSMYKGFLKAVEL